MSLPMKLKFFLLALSVTMQVYAQRNPGSPLDHLPANQELLTHFGERADFSPDNSEIAFMSGSFGHAFVINLKSRQIRKRGTPNEERRSRCLSDWRLVERETTS
jgi:hypothetical protein